MRLFVHEFASGGGFAGQSIPPSLAREGQAMLTALIEDVAALGRHAIATTTDERCDLRVASGIDVTRVSSRYESAFEKLVAWSDAVWLIAPETGGCLERLSRRVERRGKLVIGSSADGIRGAANKARLHDALRRAGVAHPEGRTLRAVTDSAAVASQFGYPLVVKPALGAGCEGVCIARNGRELRRARAANADRSRHLMVQRYIRGVAASVSLLTDGRRAVPLSINAQHLSKAFGITYRGGVTPLDHPVAAKAMEAAARACLAIGGLRGYVGVDVVLTDTEAFVIEINPRLTTAYIGVRAALDGNVAGMTIAACEGRLPRAVRMRRRVRFSSAGRVLASVPLQDRVA